jgi:hypothetical protein
MLLKVYEVRHEATALTQEVHHGLRGAQKTDVMESGHFTSSENRPPGLESEWNYFVEPMV